VPLLTGLAVGVSTSAKNANSQHGEEAPLAPRPCLCPRLGKERKDPKRWRPSVDFFFPPPPPNRGGEETEEGKKKKKGE